MMKTLKLICEVAANVELAESCEQYEKHFHSNHEAYGVLIEEVHELNDEMRNIARMCSQLMSYIREDDDGSVFMQADEIEKAAINAACESLQVAAMAKKTKSSIDSKKG